ncbi:MAG: restriction endonuclease [Anaerolineae bacterium]|nr:restriction endonuclease [Anaerolineae bacterium]
MTTATHITTSGGLLSAAFVEAVREPGARQRGCEPESFALPWAEAPKNPAALEGEIAAAWELLLERWDAVRDELPMFDVSQVRARWLLPLFELLDFHPVYLRGDTVVDEAGKLRFPLSHRGWEGEGAPVLHTVIPSQGLDERAAAAGGVKAKSPHDMLQSFLNVSPGDQWAILSNGLLLRLLRDYHHTFTKGYVEFDLESMFETRNYGDWRALYRLAHASRFVASAEVPGTSEVPGTLPPLEQFYKDSLATGVKVGEGLRGQVRQAIETLGNGFLAASEGASLRARLQADESLCRLFYGEILHVIYRVLFLLFAEQRGMMPGRDSLYAEAYSIARLRARAEGDIPREDDFTDLWYGLQATFRMVREGVPELGVFGYDGMLFEDRPVVGAQHAPRHASPLPALRNSDLLQAIRALTLIEREGVLQRISYADLGVEELGSIYESLLDYTPRVSTAAEQVEGREVPANAFFLDPRGSERKTTGSYYTHPSLVNELIKSALLPVARQRLEAAGLPVKPEGDLTGLVDLSGLSEAQRAAGEAAILALKVCDPAAGSGHFLVKANNVLGAELARIRSGDDYPTEAAVQAAKRDVLAHCVYAVDLNPMAVELCKVSLWINASVADRPLSFLDHHIRCGNSLIGATPELLAQGIPAEAFDPAITGNDRAAASRVRAQSRKEQGDFERGGGYQPALFRVRVHEPDGTVAEFYHTVSALAEEQPKAARERYAEYLAGDAFRRKKLEADCWTAAFFWPLTDVWAQHAMPDWAPTFGEFKRLQAEGPAALPEEALAQIAALAERYHFFHWHLEFPEVFEERLVVGALAPEERAKARTMSGFDVILGNPPWERIKLQEKEYFADKDAAIANARTAAERRKLIERLPRANPALHTAYLDALRESEASSHFLRQSGRYPLSAVGDINTYQVFAGLARQIAGAQGRVGIIVPSGIATDFYNQDYFRAIVEGRELVSLYDFENRQGLFPEVHRSFKFSLLTLAGGAAGAAEYAFFLHSTDDLAEAERRFGLSAAEIALMNPNTGTVPVFRTRRDAELTKKLYRAAPVLVNEATGENPWGISLGAMFHSGGASSLFCSLSELTAQGLEVGFGNRFEGDEVSHLPLYEGKMFMQYDHRAAQVTIETKNIKRAAGSDESTLEQRQDPLYSPMPRFWVRLAEIEAAIPVQFGYFVAFKKVTSPTNERTLLATILPPVAANDSIHLVFFPADIVHQRRIAFLAGLNSFVCDYISRQKLGGLNFNFWVLQQLPILPPSRYTPALLDFIVPRVVELSYTAWDLQPFAADVLAEVGEATWARWFAGSPLHTSAPPEWAAGAHPPPFVWDEGRRALLRAELDGLYAHLYGLEREELEYTLDTFPIVRRKDEAQYGEYRTKRMVLEAFESLKPLME